MTELSGKTVLGPLNRVEGDLEVKVEVAGGEVQQAWVNSPLFRGFERMLVGKPPMDALVYTPRICGICSVAQSTAAATALADYLGIEPCDNGRVATNLTMACENLADHLSHFYLFFMPDFARDGYRRCHWFPAINERFRAQTGAVMNEVLPARAQFMHMMGVLAGKWPHTLSVQPGGSTRALTGSDQLRLRMQVRAFRQFLERVVFADTLESVAALDSRELLLAWADRQTHGDFSRFIHIAQELKLEELGVTRNHFISYGAYPGAYPGDSSVLSGHLFAQGVVQWNGYELEKGAFDQALIEEDLAHAWMRGQRAHPFNGSTVPNVKSPGYSWCKAPRFDGRVGEVGALARQVVNGNPLLLDLVNGRGASVFSRVVARLMELALVVPAMERWCDEIYPEEPFCTVADRVPKSGRGFGLVEAARGSLGHWLVVENGRISQYQIIAPTTWNFSPRDRSGQPGALEQALEHTPVEGDLHDNLAVQHIIRSFDPCMVCTVH